MTEEQKRIAAIPQLCINTNLRKVSRVVSSFYDEMFRSTGLHANQMVLLIPPYLKGPIPINTMAELIGLNRTTLTRNLKPLMSKGLLTVEAGEDLRTRLVTLTPEGHDVLVDALPLWEAAQQQVIEMLGTQHSAFMDMLGVLSDLETQSE